MQCSPDALSVTIVRRRITRYLMPRQSKRIELVEQLTALFRWALGPGKASNARYQQQPDSQRNGSFTSQYEPESQSAHPQRQPYLEQKVSEYTVCLRHFESQRSEDHK